MVEIVLRLVLNQLTRKETTNVPKLAKKRDA
jgi:hypothetical protein